MLLLLVSIMLPDVKQEEGVRQGAPVEERGREKERMIEKDRVVVLQHFHLD